MARVAYLGRLYLYFTLRKIVGRLDSLLASLRLASSERRRPVNRHPEKQIKLPYISQCKIEIKPTEISGASLPTAPHSKFIKEENLKEVLEFLEEREIRARVNLLPIKNNI